MTDDRIGEIWRLPENYCKPLAFGRAIEAECRVPDGWQLVPMEPTAEQMEAVINRYCHYNDAVRDEYRTYNIERLRHDYIAAVAAAPKPDPERKHEIVPTIAAPVAQEPFGIWHQGDTEEESDFFLFKDSGDVSCPNCIKLYTAPPDQSAEVSMTPAASIFKDEVARLNAEVERLREILSAQVSQAESQQTVYRNRIAELEATIEAQRTLYANCIKISHEADELEHKCNRLERQQKVLVEALEKLARLGNGEHYGNSEGNCIAIAALASVKGNAKVSGGRLADRPSEAV
jgi:uncharacterized Zn finger protein (UPF0148 family)